MVLWFYYFIILLFYYFIVLLFYCFIVLLFYYILLFLNEISDEKNVEMRKLRAIYRNGEIR
ncbi:uncharacterized protein ASCRUDRAFT_146300 [Ascoidea rubescens DSM 1968]|uniref:Uncharacterized protein n=1 Tax=Ascoidea rubescens DSM 1968 TaxID=1344418 RepID=A0A1D2VHJ3_9ASCO|nr:hypothetical protein ASCRUDRAFT_146300 [Ascoidea rubescens DSM 1968]ODV61124.1 hypothetical protein ASCRUDRAFT_146300 [Ascoidea rubescens DSM 1968]